MRVFVAGATGVIGARLVPFLVEAGHEVAGMTRSAGKAAWIEALGARPIVCDVYDPTCVREAIRAFSPDVVISELTDLPDDPDRLPDFAAANARMRREGIRNLVEALGGAGSPRLLVESVAWQLSGEGGEAVAELERVVLGAGGTVLRYGRLFGPGTYHEGEPPPPPRVHVDEAARRTAALLDAGPGIVTIAGD